MSSTAPILLAFATLLGTPFLALIAAHHLSTRTRTLQHRIIKLLLLGLSSITLAIALGLTTSLHLANLLLLSLTYLAFGTLAFTTFRLRPKPLGILLGILACLPLLFGIMLSTIGSIGIVFILNDTLPIHTELTAPTLKCYVTSFGNATTTGGYDVTLKRPVPILSILEYTIHRQRFPDSRLQPTQACQHAQTTLAQTTP